MRFFCRAMINPTGEEKFTDWFSKSRDWAVLQTK
jgi:hypothetical protein